MGKRRHRYDRQFKLATARLVTEGDIPVRDLSLELDVPDNTLRRWAAEYEKNGEAAFPGNGNAVRNKDFEIAKLNREVQDLKEEVDLLKNFRAFLTKSQRRDSSS